MAKDDRLVQVEDKTSEILKNIKSLKDGLTQEKKSVEDKKKEVTDLFNELQEKSSELQDKKDHLHLMTTEWGGGELGSEIFGAPDSRSCIVNHLMLVSIDGGLG